MSIGSSPFLTADVDGMVGAHGARLPRFKVEEKSGDLSDARLDELRWRVLSGYYDLVDVTDAIAARLLAPSRLHNRG